VKIITSKDNPVLKSARKLHTRKGREEMGAFLVEGKKLISEAVSAGFTVECVFINAGALERGEAAKGEYSSEVALEEKLFRDLSGTVTPQPYMAVVKNREAEIEEFHRRSAEAGKDELYHDARNDKIVKRVLVLDRIGDPGNVGTVVRSALAAGMDGVWCVKGTADVFSDKTVRASAGAVFHLPVHEGLTAKACISLAADVGARLLVCNADGADLYHTDLTGSFALVIGNEGSGPQEAFLDAADSIVGIPMAPGAESLNAATAAAIVMYEAWRQSG